MGPKLLLMTNRKWRMCFRLVPKSSTLDDLELLYVQIFSEFCTSWHGHIAGVRWTDQFYCCSFRTPYQH